MSEFTLEDRIRELEAGIEDLYKERDQALAERDQAIELFRAVKWIQNVFSDVPAKGDYYQALKSIHDAVKGMYDKELSSLRVQRDEALAQIQKLEELLGEAEWNAIKEDL